MKRTSNHSEQRLFREEILSFTREICVCAHLTQTRDALEKCAEMGIRMEKDAKIYVAGHTGMVGSAICRVLEREGYHNIIKRTHKELELCRQQDVEDFFAE